MKTLGLLGGMSWESTVTYYQIINETVNRVIFPGLQACIYGNHREAEGEWSPGRHPGVHGNRPADSPGGLAPSCI